MAEPSSSYKDVTVGGNARVHAGNMHQHGHVINNNYASESVPKQHQPLAPADSLVHQNLYRAAKEGQDTSRLEYLLNQGADIDAKDMTGLTALHYAAFRGDEGNTRFLLARGADVNTTHRQIGTPLHVAALRGYAEVVRILLQKRAEPASSSETLGTPLHCAYFSGSIPCVEAIVGFIDDKGDDPQPSVPVLLGLLAELADQQLAPFKIQQVVQRHRRVQDGQTYNDTPAWAKDDDSFGDDWCKRRLVVCLPVLLAAERSHFILLKWHYGMRPWVDVLDEQIWHFQDGRESLVHAFGRSRRSRNAPSEELRASNSSAWSYVEHETSHHREEDQIKAPIGRSVPPEKTILMWAAASLELDLIDHILTSGGTVNKRDNFGRTALHYAAQPFADVDLERTGDCVKLFVAGGADVNAVDMFGNSPLQMAMSSHHPAGERRFPWRWTSGIHARCVAPFLDNLASTGESGAIDDQVQRSFLDVLTRLGGGCSPEVIRLFCERGANVCEVDNEGRTVLQRAVQALSADDVTFNSGVMSDVDGTLGGDVISILLEHGGDPNVSKTPPLLVAARVKAHESVLLALLNHGADPELADAASMPPEHEVLEYLRYMAYDRCIELPADATEWLGARDDVKGSLRPYRPHRHWYEW